MILPNGLDFLKELASSGMVLFVLKPLAPFLTEPTLPLELDETLSFMSCEIMSNICLFSFV